MEKSFNQNKLLSKITTIVLVLLVFVLTCLVISVSCFDAIIVSGESMSPTIKDGEYGYIVTTKYAKRNINRFDIIAFNYKEGEQNRKLIKRVIAFPGEEVEFKGENSDLYVDGELYKQDFIPLETQQKTCLHSVQSFCKTGSLIIPDDYYFVLGDNRDNSFDSAHGLGLIKSEDIVGVLYVLLGQYEKIYDNAGEYHYGNKKLTGIRYFL